MNGPATEGERSARLVREIFLAGFMSGLPPENVAWATHRLARNMQDVHLAAGEVLYRQGDPTTAHYFVVYGEMRLAAEGVPAWTLGERSLVGTIDLTLDRARTRTATATRDTHLLMMPASDWLDMLEDNFELMLRGVEGLAEGVHELRIGVGGGKSAAPARLRPFERSSESGPLGLVDRVVLLRGVPLFAGAEVQALLDLAAHAVEVDVEAGAVVTVHSETNDAMYVLVSGEVTALASPIVPPESPALRLVCGDVAGPGVRSPRDDPVTPPPCRARGLLRRDGRALRSRALVDEGACCGARDPRERESKTRRVGVTRAPAAWR